MLPSNDRLRLFGRMPNSSSAWLQAGLASTLNCNLPKDLSLSFKPSGPKLFAPFGKSSVGIIWLLANALKPKKVLKESTWSAQDKHFGFLECFEVQRNFERIGRLGTRWTWMPFQKNALTVKSWLSIRWYLNVFYQFGTLVIGHQFATTWTKMEPKWNLFIGIIWDNV